MKLSKFAKVQPANADIQSNPQQYMQYILDGSFSAPKLRENNDATAKHIYNTIDAM